MLGRASAGWWKHRAQACAKKAPAAEPMTLHRLSARRAAAAHLYIDRLPAASRKGKRLAAARHGCKGGMALLPAGGTPRPSRGAGEKRRPWAASERALCYHLSRWTARFTRTERSLRREARLRGGTSRAAGLSPAGSARSCRVCARSRCAAALRQSLRTAARRRYRAGPGRRRQGPAPPAARRYRAAPRPCIR